MPAAAAPSEIEETRTEEAVSLSDVSIVTEVLENTQISLIGKEKFPPERFPLLWFVGFDNDEDGNKLADEMIGAAKGKSKEVRAESYYGIQGRYLHLYFNGVPTFKDFVSNFLGDEPVMVESANSTRRRRYYLENFETEAKAVMSKMEPSLKRDQNP